jgi:cytochrome c oxidase subunit II
MRYYQEFSNFAKGVDTAFYFIFGISFFFLIALTTIMIFFVIKYNHKKHPKPVQIKDNYVLEITWTIIPLIIVIVMFYFGYIAFIPMRKAPKDSLIVKTVGRMWEWEFTYSNGKKSKDLHIPVNKPVKLEMNSADVIHGLFIPAFRVKEDLVPGKESMIWFIVNKEGEYNIFCSAYCGLRHSYMISRAIVTDENKYNQWVADYFPSQTKDLPGLDLIRKNACTGCHSIEGKRLVGPAFNGIYGKERKVVSNGQTKSVIADNEYIKRSMIDPNSEIVEGFSPNLMQSYKGVLTDEQIGQISDYLKQLK